MKNSDITPDKTGQLSKLTAENLDNMVSDVVKLLLDKGITIATAESCTGGLLSELITSVPGASKIFEIGVCTYSNKIKHEYLGVPKVLFKQYGAVSRQVALAMVDGLQKQSGADICISVTGIAGPGGGTPEKPVGTVFVGISCGRKRIVKLLKLWELKDKSRDNIRNNVAYRVFEFLKQMVSAMPEKLPEDREKNSVGKAVLNGFIPCKGDSKTQIIRKIVFILSVIAFAICLFLVADYFIDSYNNKNNNKEFQNIYNQAEQSATQVTEVTTVGMPQVVTTTKVWNLKEGAKELLEINKDVVGYLEIPDTDISYPVVQRRAEDGNEYYMNRNLYGEESNAGTIFLDWRNYFDYIVDGVQAYKNSQNLVIYGHEMKDGSMFADLKRYKDNDGYYSDHPIIELNSNYESYKYKVFAYFIADAEDETETKFDCWNTLNFTSEEQFYEFVNNAKKRSFDHNDVDVRYGDQLLTLQTCHGMFPSARFFVMARLVREGEDPYEGTDNVRENENILWPTIYYQWNSNNYDPDAEFESYPLTSN